MTPQFLREEASRFRGMAETVEREASKLRLLKMAADYEQRAKAADELAPATRSDSTPSDPATTAPTLTEPTATDPTQATPDQAAPTLGTSTLTAPPLAASTLAARAPGDAIPGGQIKVRPGRRTTKELSGTF